jgi:WD40 repeat protein
MKRSALVTGFLIGALLAQRVEAQAQDPRATSPPRRPQLWAIIVGVGSAVDPKIRAQSSREAVRQAYRVLGWLSGPAGWDRSHSLLLTDLGGNNDPGAVASPAPNINPSKQNLDWAFRQWLAPRAKPGDVIVFYFAGQARAVLPAGPSAHPEYYLLPTDVLAENLAIRGWALENALDGYAKGGKYQIICWLGTALRTEQAAAREKVRPLDWAVLSRDWLRRLARWPGVTVWLASDTAPATPAADPAAAFTQALLAGFGKRDHKQNLNACLRSLQETSTLKGFRSIGGVPPQLSLWADQLGEPAKSRLPEMVLQVGHSDGVRDIVSTPDDRLVISASQDSTIRVWSPGQNVLLRVLTGHTVGATALALDGNGRWLASGGGRGEVLIHDLAENFARKSVARQPHDEKSRVDQIVMLPDGSHFISIDSQARAYLWDLNAPSLRPQRWLENVDCRGVACGGHGDNGIVTAWCGDGSIRLFGPSGAGGTVIPATPSRPSAIAVSPEGRMLALGCEDGRVVLHTINGGRRTERKTAAAPIRLLAFSSLSALVVGYDEGVALFAVKDGAVAGDGALLMTGHGAEKLAISPNGGLLAACAKDTGALQVWRLDANPPRRAILADQEAGVLSLAFSSDGRALITGSKLGSVRTWPLGEPGNVPARTFLAHRAKIQKLAASPGRRFLLMINDLNQAQLWDLGQRTCRGLPGSWASGVFLGDDTLILADRPEGELPGRLVRIQRSTLAADPAFFALSSGAFKVAPDARFEAATLSPDGTRIAASAGQFQQPLVCVWDTRSGRLTHWISASTLNEAVFTLSFSHDGRQLLTAGDSAEAKLWDLSQRGGPLESPATTFQEPSSRNITSVQFRPGPHRQMVTGHSNGRLLLWSWADGKARQEVPLQILAERFFVGAVRAVTFTPEGRYLAAAGDGTMIWLAEMGAQVRPIRNLGAAPHHFEQINALAVWPASTGLGRPAPLPPPVPGNPAIAQPPRPPILISGSDDTTVKFWDLDKRTLLGAFSASAATGDRTAAAGPTRDLDWVLYTADGHFDASKSGRELVRFRHGDSALSMEQFDDTKLYSFDLSEVVRSGRILEPAQLEPPPPVAIDPPLRDDPALAEAQLTIALGSAELKDIRLYHNGVPVPSGLEDAQPPLPERFAVRVRLLPGSNRFYAMASRDGTFDSRSQEVEIPYDGPIEPGKLHVIALGVGNYAREKLSFAKRDAERLSDVLHARGLTPGQERGRSFLFTDSQVNRRNVAAAFKELGLLVKGRPQDTVVLFLAGHTGVFENERFCLLLSKYPFPAAAPLAVAARGANFPIAPGAKVMPDDVLPYTTLAVNLMRLDALNRLVIVDACQAEYILDDPQVTAIQKWMEIGSRKARTSYLMAARRGEPALEIERLGHGLFTYTLLRGMREVPLREEPKAITDLKLRPDADYNGDGTVTTAELDTYVKEALPPIAAVFPNLFVSRQGPESVQLPVQRGGAEAARQRLDQSLRLQTAPVSFPLIQLSRNDAAGS